MMPTPIHFLIVDDQPITRLIIIAMLNSLGYTYITEAEDGLEALNILRIEKQLGMPANFVITDWNMPVMDGLTLLQAIRANGELRHVPVLMMTADTKTNRAVVATQAGADGFLDKQLLSVHTLKEQLDRILEQH